MKRFISIICMLLFFILLLGGCSKYPNNPPELNIIGNSISFQGTVCDGNWINSENGSSFADGLDVEVAKNIKAVAVRGGSTLNLKLTYSKDISNFRVQKIEGTSLDTRKSIDLNISNYKMEVPKEKGEYTYNVEVDWDDKHGVGYVFKIEVK